MAASYFHHRAARKKSLFLNQSIFSWEINVTPEDWLTKNFVLLTSLLKNADICSWKYEQILWSLEDTTPKSYIVLEGQSSSKS